MTLPRFSVPVLLAIALAAPAAADAAGRSFGTLRFEPCSLTAEGLPGAVEAQCSRIEVAENRADPDSRRIELALAWVPASGTAAPDPVFMIAGGPGQSARQSYPQLHAAFRDVRRSRDVLLLDARGTGGSHPLVCRDEKGAAAISDADDNEAFDAERARDFARRCAQELGKIADLRHYGTGEHIDDLDEVRQRLGIERINLIGISYGTRVAQQYAARYPQATRAVVLDSVAPNSLPLGNEHAANLEAALKTQFQRCRDAAACVDQLGDPGEQLQRLHQTLRRDDLAPVRFRAAQSGAWEEERPSFGHLAILLRLYAYSPEAASLLPYVIHEAANGRYEAMLAQATHLGRSLSDQIFHGMQLSVMCTEDVDEFRIDDNDRGSVLGAEFIEFAKAQCDAWPRGRRDPDFRQPLTGEVPVLLLSGEYDPVTPPRYGDEVASHLPNGRHLILPGQGHSVVSLGCAPKLFAQFIEQADAHALDATCLDRLKPLPPFAGAYGWEP